MKKFISIFVIALALVFSGCDDDKPIQPSYTEPTPQKQELSQQYTSQPQVIHHYEGNNGPGVGEVIMGAAVGTMVGNALSNNNGGGSSTVINKTYVNKTYGTDSKTPSSIKSIPATESASYRSASIVVKPTSSTTTSYRDPAKNTSLTKTKTALSPVYRTATKTTSYKSSYTKPTYRKKTSSFKRSFSKPSYRRK
jgi:hypothetical protein